MIAWALLPHTCYSFPLPNNHICSYAQHDSPSIYEPSMNLLPKTFVHEFTLPNLLMMFINQKLLESLAIFNTICFLPINSPPFDIHNSWQPLLLSNCWPLMMFWSNSKGNYHSINFTFSCRQSHSSNHYHQFHSLLPLVYLFNFFYLKFCTNDLINSVHKMLLTFNLRIFKYRKKEKDIE